MLVLWLQRYIQNSAGTPGAHVLGATATTTDQEDNRAECEGDGGTEGLLRPVGWVFWRSGWSWVSKEEGHSLETGEG